MAFLLEALKKGKFVSKIIMTTFLATQENNGILSQKEVLNELVYSENQHIVFRGLFGSAFDLFIGVLFSVCQSENQLKRDQKRAKRAKFKAIFEIPFSFRAIIRVVCNKTCRPKQTYFPSIHLTYSN